MRRHGIPGEFEPVGTHICILVDSQIGSKMVRYHKWQDWTDRYSRYTISAFDVFICNYRYSLPIITGFDGNDFCEVINVSVFGWYLFFGSGIITSWPSPIMIDYIPWIWLQFYLTDSELPLHLKWSGPLSLNRTLLQISCCFSLIDPHTLNLSPPAQPLMMINGIKSFWIFDLTQFWFPRCTDLVRPSTAINSSEFELNPCVIADSLHTVLACLKLSKRTMRLNG